MTVTGWTLEYIRACPWPDIWGLWEYWAENPPCHVLMAAGVGAGFPMRRRHSAPTTTERKVLGSPTGARSDKTFSPEVQAKLREMRKSSKA